MRKLIVAEHISLDGVIQAPGAPKEDPSDNFRLGGWTAPYMDDAIGQAIQELFSQPFDLLLGRRTYDIWAAYWPNVRAGNPIADKFNSVAKYVATHRADSLEWQNSHALKGDIADAVRALKKQKGPDLQTWGSGDMLHQLLAAGLVDELWLVTYPVVLGRGKRLFSDDADASAFTVVNSTSTKGGVLINRYVRGGKVRTGTVGEEVEKPRGGKR
jgi:dihydrofolate reductase